MDRKIQEDELRQNNGQEGQPAYVAYQGKVYDVSESKMWRNGVHVRRHNAGGDLTSELPAAPHDESVFERVKLVGEFAGETKPEAEQQMSPLLEWFLNWHPHNISVHFPIAYTAALVVLLIINFLFGSDSFETAAYYMLWGSVIMAPIAIILGFVAWSFDYGRIINSKFIGKIVLSIAFLIVGVVALTLRASNPAIFTTANPMQWVYFALAVIMVVLVSVLGLLGDKILHGN